LGDSFAGKMESSSNAGASFVVDGGFMLVNPSARPDEN